jgi:hypothetical protein
LNFEPVVCHINKKDMKHGLFKLNVKLLLFNLLGTDVETIVYCCAHRSHMPRLRVRQERLEKE